MVVFPAAIHHYIKRDMNGPSRVIVVVVTSAVLFNMILFATWCIIGRRRARMKQKLIKSAYAANPKASRWNLQPAALWESTSTSQVALLPLSPAKIGSPQNGSVPLSTAGLADRLHTPQDIQSFTFVADVISNTESPVIQQSLTRGLPTAEIPVPISPSTASTHGIASPQRPDNILAQSAAPNTGNRSPPSTSFGHGGGLSFTSPFPEIKGALSPGQNGPNAVPTSSIRPERSHYRTTSESILTTPAPYYPKHTRSLALNESSKIISSRDSLPLSAVGGDRPRETSLHHSLSLPLSPSRAAASSSPRGRGFPRYLGTTSAGIPSTPASMRTGSFIPNWATTSNEVQSS